MSGIDILLTVILLAILCVFMLIIIDYMHSVKGMSYKRIAAIMFPIWILWSIMMYLAITY